MQHTPDLRGRIIRPFSWLLFAAATAGISAQTLPAMPPTALPGQTAQGAPQTLPTPTNTPHHAEVIYANGAATSPRRQLQPEPDPALHLASNRSEDHRRCRDQRVFGNYGPGPISTVLATLLDGTGTDILLLGGNASTPPELILTPRNGGPEPPGPNSPTYAMYDDTTDRQSPVAPPRSNAAVTQPPSQTPVAAQPETPQASNPPAAAPAANTAKQPLTPEMVMQQLLQMQKQQQKQTRRKTRIPRARPHPARRPRNNHDNS